MALLVVTATTDLTAPHSPAAVWKCMAPHPLCHLGMHCCCTCRFELLCRIRIARGFGTLLGRRQLVKQRLLAFNVLLQCSPTAGEFFAVSSQSRTSCRQLCVLAAAGWLQCQVGGLPVSSGMALPPSLCVSTAVGHSPVGGGPANHHASPALQR